MPLLWQAFTIKDRIGENEKGEETDRRKKEMLKKSFLHRAVSDATGLGIWLLGYLLRNKACFV